ncbi:hypothetical protein FNF27_07465 [Cafeteria roenbergensis]|uniref:Uncharacterized protein n=1 Tax=Cafeteria roenbergensis TaxID=33653 RepID=A0A5A8C209_CAFRO|nr:hypothetical protein FNF31_07906 [Cafeteria roenbergensis]KAA0166726.1 hypothetical protein FNF27_07465 [Cafeteria roenbergensis]
MAIFDDVLDEADLAELRSPPRPQLLDLRALEVAVAAGLPDAARRVCEEAEARIALVCGTDAGAVPVAGAWPQGTWPVGAPAAAPGAAGDAGVADAAIPSQHRAWVRLCRETMALGLAVASGRFVEALALSPTGRALLREPSAAEEEAGEVTPASRPDLTRVMARRAADVVVSGARACLPDEAADDDDGDDVGSGAEAAAVVAGTGRSAGAKGGVVRLLRDPTAGDYDGDSPAEAAPAEAEAAEAEAACQDAAQGAAGPPAVAPSAMRAACVAWVAASALQLWMQSNFTGPEPAAEELEAVYPPAVLAPWLRRAAPSEAAAGIAGVRPSLAELRRVRLERERVLVAGLGAGAAQRAKEAAEKLTGKPADAAAAGDADPAAAAADDAAATAADADAAASGGGTNDEASLIDEGLALPVFHKACLEGLVAGIANPYRRQALPALLLIARSLLDGLTGITEDAGPATAALPAEPKRAKRSEGGPDGAGPDAPSGSAADAALRSALTSPLVREAWAAAASGAPSCFWWAARAAVSHHSSMEEAGAMDVATVDPSVMAAPAQGDGKGSGSAGRKGLGSKTAGAVSPALLLAARRGFAFASASLLGPEHSPAVPAGVWSAEDIFRASLVREELAGAGDARFAAARREEDGAIRAKARSAGAAAAAIAAAEGAAAAGLAAAAAGEGEGEGARWAGMSAGQRDLVARLLLEWGLALHLFERRAAAKTAFFLAKGAAELRTQLTGALGRRTKHQVWEAPILVLKAASGRAVSDRADGDARVAAMADEASPEGAAAAGGARAAADSGASAASGAGSDVPEGGVVIKELTETIGIAVRKGRFGVGEVRLDDIHSDQIRMEEPVLTATEADETSAGGMARRTAHWKSSFATQQEWAAKFGSGVGMPLEGTPEAAAAAEAEAARAAAADAAEAAAAAAAPASLADGPLSTMQQGLLLALCLDVQNSSPLDGLTRAEMKPYIRRVMSDPRNWLVHSAALLGRCDLEFADHKVMDRAVLQMQVLVDQHSDRLTAMRGRRAGTGAGLAKAAAEADSVDESSATERLRWLACLPWPSRWGLKRLLADRYSSMGVAASAAALYEDLGLWGDVADCYVIMDKPMRARRLLDRLLVADPTPRLWCVMGAVSDTHAPYVRAWEESGRRYGPARLALGKRYFDKHAWAESAAALQEGLAVSPDHALEWAVLGACAMRLHDYAVAREEKAKADAAAAADSAAGEPATGTATGAPAPAPQLIRIDDAPMSVRRKAATLAAMTPQQTLELSARGFTESVRCDDSRSDSWANLGAILARLGRWRAASVAMERGMRSDAGRRNWRAWDNLATAAIRSNEHGRVMMALAGAMAIKERGLDPTCPPILAQPLAAVTAVVVESLLREGTPFDVARKPLARMHGDPLDILDEADEDDEPEAEADGEEDDDEQWHGAGVPPVAELDAELVVEDEDEDDASGQRANDSQAAADAAASERRPEGVPERGLSGLNPPEEALVDALGSHARVHARQLSRFMDRAAMQASSSAVFWRLRAALDRALGRAGNALEAKLRECRCLGRSEWQRGGEDGEKMLRFLTRACGELVQDFLREAPSAEPIAEAAEEEEEEEEGGEATEAAADATTGAVAEDPAPALASAAAAAAAPSGPVAGLGQSEARGGRRNAALFLRGVIRRAEAGKVLHEHPLVDRLRTMLAAVEAGESAMAALGHTEK